MQYERDLFFHPGWELYKLRLQREVDAALNVLETGSTMDEVQAARARLKLARHLLNVPELIVGRAAEITQQLDAADQEA